MGHFSSIYYNEPADVTFKLHEDDAVIKFDESVNSHLAVRFECTPAGYEQVFALATVAAQICQAWQPMYADAVDNLDWSPTLRHEANVEIQHARHTHNQRIMQTLDESAGYGGPEGPSASPSAEGGNGGS